MLARTLLLACLFTRALSVSAQPPETSDAPRRNIADIKLLNPADARTLQQLPPVPEQLPPAPGEALPGDYLSVEDVVSAIYASFPGLEAAMRERQIASGKALSAMGAFDTGLTGEALSRSLGFYENYRSGLGVKQYLWGGSQVFGGHRIGRGIFEPWYLERETNKGGEFKAGFAIPLLRDRDIDKRRAEVFKARLQRQAAEPVIQLEIIDAVRAGSLAYWDWVLAGSQRDIARAQLELAQTRQEKLRKSVELGSVMGIELVDNERLIVSRRAKLIAADRKLQQAAIKLSVFLRSVDGSPLLAMPDQLPPSFPTALPPDMQQTGMLIQQALGIRPELQLLTIASRQANVDLNLASNMLLPALNGVMTASQDTGEPTSSKRDKSELELEAGVLLDVPLQRREARGKIRTARAKIAQIAAKRQLVQQKIAADVQSLMVALRADYRQIEQAEQSAALARRMEEAEYVKFDAGNSTILLINLREQAAAEAQLLVIEATADYFMSLAELHAAIAGELAGISTESIAKQPDGDQAPEDPPTDEQ